MGSASIIPTKRRPRMHRAEKSMPLPITNRREDVLKLFIDYTYVDCELVEKGLGLCHSQAVRYLTDLKHCGPPDNRRQFYIRPCLDNHTFCLDTGGRAYLETLGYEFNRPRPDELANVQPAYLQHWHDTNMLMLLAKLLSKEVDISIARMLSDKNLHGSPMKVKIPVKGEDGNWKKNKQDVTLIPDVFIDWEMGDDQEHATCWEIDRGSMPVKSIKSKAAAYLQALKGEFRAKLGVRSIKAVVFVVCSGGELTLPRRVFNILKWLEEVLAEYDSQKYSRLYKVTGANLDTLTPTQLFTKAVFYQPYHRRTGLGGQRPSLEMYYPVALLGG